MAEAVGTHEGEQRGAWAVLAILTSINLLNYIDRFIFPAVAESIKHSSLHPSDTAIGFGIDGVSRRLSHCRAVLRRGRRSPAAHAMGSRGHPVLERGHGARRSRAHDAGAHRRARRSSASARPPTRRSRPPFSRTTSRRRTRGRAFAIFFAAAPVGAALGYGIGGFVDAHWGWREAFFVAGAPGMLLAWLVLRMRAPVSSAMPVGAPAGALRMYRQLLREPQYRLTVLGYTAYTFAVGGIGAWMPVFVQRAHGLSSKVANNQIGVMLAISGLVGAIGGGWIADRLRRSYDGGVPLALGDHHRSRGAPRMDCVDDSRYHRVSGYVIRGGASHIYLHRADQLEADRDGAAGDARGGDGVVHFHHSSAGRRSFAHADRLDFRSKLDTARRTGDSRGSRRERGDMDAGRIARRPAPNHRSRRGLR